MAFKGEILTVSELLELANAAPEPDWHAICGEAKLRHTAASNAAECRRLLESGDSLAECWRFGILQTLDDYTSAVRRGSLALGAEVFAEEPERTGSQEIDAAFASLADHLAERDGWQPPLWVQDPSRTTQTWYPSVPVIFREEATRDSPRAFRERGIFITSRSLARA